MLEIELFWHLTVCKQKPILKLNWFLWNSIRKFQVILLDGSIPWRKEAEGRRRRQDGRHSNMWLWHWEKQKRKGYHGAEATRVSSKQEVAKESLETEGVSSPFNSTNRTQKTSLSPTKSNIHIPLKIILSTTRKYTERQQDIHQPQISVL